MMVLKKKTIIIITLVVLIVAAGYISFRYGGTLKVDNTENSNIVQTEDTSITDTAAVNTQVAAGYFIDEKIGRENKRTLDKQTLTDIIDNKNTSKEAKTDAEKKLLNIVDYSEKEMKIEALIKTKGFEDALVFLDDASANVTVKSKTMTSDQVSQIKNIVCRESGLAASKVMVQNRE
jgi:stage III sporulation protein AH